MIINKVRVRHYKSFEDSLTIPLTAGFNVVVGENNAGKTALLEACALRFADVAHRSERTLAKSGPPRLQQSTVEIGFQIAPDEARRMLLSINEFGFQRSENERISNAQAWLERRLAEPIQLDTVWVANQLQAAAINGGALIKAGTSVNGPSYVSNRDAGSFTAVNADSMVQNTSTAEWHFAHAIRAEMYIFSAERLNIGASRITTDVSLLPNASNLATVLHALYAQAPLRFQRYIREVRAVLPQVKNITLPVVGDGTTSVAVWALADSSDRDDLAVPLANSGTGIGQVLSMLYVVFTSQFARIIIIDEPQSFLHPGAVKQLFNILRAYSQHQYIISTHSASAIAAATPESLILVKRADMASAITVLNPTQQDDLRSVLQELGASQSDVFGYDRILWVEGDTEAACFQLLIAARGRFVPVPTGFIPVRSTDELKGKKARLILDIYDRMSTGAALLPPAVAFLVDREGATESELTELKKRSRGKMHFLPRRMYENYLIDHNAIAAVLASQEAVADERALATKAEQLIAEIRSSGKYVSGTCPDGVDPDDFWRTSVDAACLLEAVFQQLSEQRVEYRKVLHGRMLTEWILKNNETALSEVSELVVNLIGAVPTE